MANGYTNDYSKFPASIMEATNFKDVNSDVLSIINQVETALANNDYYTAQKLISDNELEDYIINAEKINWIIEEIRNAQIYAKTKGQQIVYVNSISDLPENPVDGDIYRVRKG